MFGKLKRNEWLSTLVQGMLEFWGTSISMHRDKAVGEVVNRREGCGSGCQLIQDQAS